MRTNGDYAEFNLFLGLSLGIIVAFWFFAFVRKRQSLLSKKKKKDVLVKGFEKGLRLDSSPSLENTASGLNRECGDKLVIES